MAKATNATPGGTLFSNYSQYVAQTILAARTGSVPGIPNPLATGTLDTAILTDPAKIKAYKDTVADQMNVQSAGPKFEDLSIRVADIQLNTIVQGAGTLQVHLIDPYLVLLVSGFISTDQNGYLWPPIDINFPTGSECVWRLCQCQASSDLSQPNLILTFEDRIVSLLREISPGNGGIQQGLPNQTLGGFFKMLVDSTNSILKTDIRLIELISPQDPNYTVPITQLPHAEAKLKPKGLDAQLQQLLANLDQNTLGAFPKPGQSSQISSLEQQLTQLLQNQGSHILGNFPDTPPSERGYLGYPVH